MAGCPRAPRLVVRALKLFGKSVPWHRVIGKQSARYGKISIHDPLGATMQRQLLGKEGVRLDAAGRIDLLKYGWLSATQKR